MHTTRTGIMHPGGSWIGIALAIWRQQRAARPEAALATVAMTGLTPDRSEVQRWTERIVNAWVPVMHQQPQRDPDSGLGVR